MSKEKEDLSGNQKGSSDKVLIEITSSPYKCGLGHFDSPEIFNRPRK